MKENPDFLMQSCPAGISYETLVDYHEKRLEAAEFQKMSRHLEQGCPVCASQLSLLSRISQAIQLDKQSKPAPALAAQLQLAFRNRYKQPGLLDRLAAVLTFDSRTSLVQGLRGQELAGFYQLLYQADVYELDLQVVPSPGQALFPAHFTLLGQILPFDGSGSLAEASLTAAGGNRFSTRLSDNGEIEFQDLPGGTYQLEIKLKDKILVIEKLGLS